MIATLIGFGAVFVALVSIAARTLDSSVFVSTLRKALIPAVLLIPFSAALSLLPLIFGSNHTIAISKAFEISEPKYQDVALLSVLSAQLIRDGSCYGGIIPKTSLASLPEQFKIVTAAEGQDFLLWLIDTRATGAVANSEYLMLDTVKSANGIWAGWITLKSTEKPNAIRSRLVQNP